MHGRWRARTEHDAAALKEVLVGSAHVKTRSQHLVERASDVAAVLCAHQAVVQHSHVFMRPQPWQRPTIVASMSVMHFLNPNALASSCHSRTHVSHACCRAPTAWAASCHSRMYVSHACSHAHCLGNVLPQPHASQSCMFSFPLPWNRPATGARISVMHEFSAPTCRKIVCWLKATLRRTWHVMTACASAKDTVHTQ